MRYVEGRDRASLEAVGCGIYLMTSEAERGRFRSGVIGIRGEAGSSNNAWKRIGQLNAGDLRHYAPWKFALLFELDEFRRMDLGKIESSFQGLLHKEFCFDGRMFCHDNVDYVCGFAKAAMISAAELNSG